jgi:hypothetical protein
LQVEGRGSLLQDPKNSGQGRGFPISGLPVFATKISESGHPELYRHRSGVQEEVFTGIKYFGSDHNEARDVYAPYWANPDWICNSLGAYLPSSKNMEFNLKVKKNGKERAVLMKEEVHSLNPDMMVHKSVQSLLVKNRYLVLEETPLFASNYLLDIDKNLLSTLGGAKDLAPHLARQLSRSRWQLTRSRCGRGQSRCYLGELSRPIL